MLNISYVSKKRGALADVPGAGFGAPQRLGVVFVFRPALVAESPEASDAFSCVSAAMKTGMLIARPSTVLVTPLSVAVSRTPIVCPMSASVTT